MTVIRMELDFVTEGPPISTAALAQLVHDHLDSTTLVYRAGTDGKVTLVELSTSRQMHERMGWE